MSDLGALDRALDGDPAGALGRALGRALIGDRGGDPGARAARALARADAMV